MGHVAVSFQILQVQRLLAYWWDIAKTRNPITPKTTISTPSKSPPIIRLAIRCCSGRGCVMPNVAMKVSVSQERIFKGVSA